MKRQDLASPPTTVEGGLQPNGDAHGSALRRSAILGVRSRVSAIDEYDFYAAQYQKLDGALPKIRIENNLTELSPETRQRLHGCFRGWLAELGNFANTIADALDLANDRASSGVHRSPLWVDWIPLKTTLSGTFFGHS